MSRGPAVESMTTSRDHMLDADVDCSNVQIAAHHMASGT